MLDEIDELLGTAAPQASAAEAPSVLSEPLPLEMDERALSGLLRLSLSQVRTKAREGVFVRSRPGRYDVAESVGRYVERLREHAARAGRPSAGGDDLKAEKLRLTKAQADAQELKNRQAAGDLVAIADVRREWIVTAADLRSQILAIPARVAARMGLSREAAVTLEDEVRLALEELTDER